MKLIMMMMMINSTISMKMNHPISLGTILMLQSIFTCLINIMLTKNSWYSMILFITFSSGMMIMFIYMSSISSNEKFNPSLSYLTLAVVLLISTLVLNPDFNFLTKFNLSENLILFNENEEKLSIYKNISMSKLFLSVMITMLILMILIAISNLINSFEGPLKLTYEKF
uniref:NADH-ubiquinone oxidoreductase chain 6 n=1 Tax=Saccharosydne procerus TaxID=871471 RepID=A0A455JVE3_9HEMI|nr:NADH dehydrogenase subunit 6 [Saccharosydne procerus]AVV32039.1 NADH dehydrogenase subunit 6 [Saccharosydne procerus]